MRGPQHRDDTRLALRVLACVPLLFAIISLPLMLEMVGPNAVYGVRTPATFASEEAWYRANGASGVAGVVAGLVGFAGSVMVVRSKASPQRKNAVCIGILLAVTAAMIVPGLLAA